MPSPSVTAGVHVSHPLPGRVPSIASGPRWGAVLEVRFSRADVGRKVTLRHRLEGDLDAPDGPSLTDAVGILEAWDGNELSVRRRKGDLVTVAADTLVAGKVVAPEFSAVDVARAAARDWVPHTVEPLGDWELRANDGVNLRSNSALALTVPADVDAQLDAVIAWYRERDLDPRLSVVRPSDVADAAAQAGWTEGPSADVMTGTLAHVVEVASTPRDVDVTFAATASDEWLELAATGKASNGLRELLESGEGGVFASISDAEGIVAVARSRADGLWCGLTNVEVAPRARRQGLARDIVAALAERQLQAGARHMWLQVDHTNDAAITLYEGLGFTKHHEYAYWTAP